MYKKYYHSTTVTAIFKSMWKGYLSHKSSVANQHVSINRIIFNIKLSKERMVGRWLKEWKKWQGPSIPNTQRALPLSEMKEEKGMWQINDKNRTIKQGQPSQDY